MSKIDYKNLLAKYIEFIGAEEGSTFLSYLYREEDGMHRGTASHGPAFTAKEMIALKDCATQSAEPPQ